MQNLAFSNGPQVLCSPEQLLVWDGGLWAALLAESSGVLKIMNQSMKP